jgi:hypothetical protein
VTVVATATAVLFEVMDKEFPLWLVLVFSAVAGTLGFLLSRWKPWTTMLALLFAAFFAGKQVEELIDPFVGPAIRQEEGLGYVVLSWLAIAFMILSPLLGAVIGLRRRSAHG